MLVRSRSFHLIMQLQKNSHKKLPQFHNSVYPQHFIKRSSTLHIQLLWPSLPTIRELQRKCEANLKHPESLMWTPQSYSESHAWIPTISQFSLPTAPLENKERLHVSAPATSFQEKRHAQNSKAHQETCSAENPTHRVIRDDRAQTKLRYYHTAAGNMF